MDPQADELRRLMQRMFRRFGALATDATPCGKPLSIAHAHALMTLLGADDASQQELGRGLGIDKSNVARLCARMVEDGHVTQRPCEVDGRSRRVALTPRGRRLAQEVDAASRARFSALLEALPAGQREAILDALRRLLEGIDALPAAPHEERKAR